MVKILIGIFTVYTAIGLPLYCDDGSGLIYAETTPPWIALPVIEYKSGRAECGDEILIWGEWGELRLRGWDAGPLHLYHIAAYPDLPIIGDLPMHIAPFGGLSAKGRMINVSAAKRLLEGRVNE